MAPRFDDFHRRSIQERDAFWAEQAGRIDWHVPPQHICDYDNPPFAKWFVGGQTNLCHNAVDRHLAERADQNALIAISTETGTEKVYTYRELHAEVQRMAAVLQSLGVQKGDRVQIYMPMIAEAAFAMLACARLGAIHSVVFGGFASAALASRIDDAEPKVIISADAGSRGGRVVAYKPLLDEALQLASHKPAGVLIVDRGLAPAPMRAGRDHDWTSLRALHADAQVACTWVESTDPSYTLYTSGTTGRPKGVQRDTGGYTVALAASMPMIFGAEAGQTFFCTSDIGWVVGHSYIIYGPLIAGMATVLYEGLPIRPDAGIWWSIVEKYRVTHMFSAPTAIRVLKKHDAEYLHRHDISSLKALWLAGEPLDEPTAQWISQALGKPIIDNYWQTETGWPILTLCNGVEQQTTRFGSPGKAVYGYDVKLIDEATGEELRGAGQKGVLAIEGPLPPGCMQTVWRDDQRFVNTYWKSIPGRMIYSTFDWGIRDEDGYFFILGRTDDVINVAGHRLGTREIEECISAHPQVAEVAVVGVADALKGQAALAFAVPRTALEGEAERAALEADVMKLVDARLGAVARPSRVVFVSALPKTRSGKLLRRAMQAVAEGRDPGDLSTMEDPAALAQVQQQL
ncbi:propionate--CoA ligase [Delftia tsuruhatensis]|uniref:propionate--CoA ligase n=1 Tax=Delftia tsuruhatensis TaxID=180282 RepID=UPI0022609DCF|nr:propionate--CoA ligase [Delftia tsuruhatensis]MCX7506693.1 propionate--CoA ligase [Delftia tsuruhatensis]MDH0776985.1 propionate--CoA ligase [Delftia tsuruhatensis]MDH1460684.1 propionate--CoA ligase [Delftia tsuruhatensis]MDH1826394.1 propionate--CoA ligase [Delftia tsuruhatensis]WGG13743.1 propionate--CoA ligase [Delftia tsuruhatensis]